MNAKQYIFIAFLFVLSQASGQLPSNDLSWQLKKQDDFNSVNTNDWHLQYDHGCRMDGAIEMMDASNVTSNGGYLRLKAEFNPSPIWQCTQFGVTTNHQYRSGTVWSRFEHKYGYWEVSAKQPSGQGWGPAFWLYRDWPCNFYNEIDFMERFGDDLYDFECIYHWATYNNCIQQRHYYSEDVLGNNLTIEHKYALEWSPNRMIFYFDDIPIKTYFDNNYTPVLPMHTILSFGLRDNPLPSQNNFPAYVDIDYLKIYQLNTACSTVESICTFNPTIYNYALKKSISIAGGSCTSNINTSSNVALRATDYVLLGDGTTITANGSGYFLADVIPCTD